ncbi:hypothetical protein BH11PSE8_BH11PSE8_27640 [soil metagenome]
MTPGIDLAGTVPASSNPAFREGDQVVLNGFEAGATHRPGQGAASAAGRSIAGAQSAAATTQHPNGFNMARPSVRQQIVDASLAVFQTHGYNGTSIQDLTDAAGVPKGSFYNHFKGKEDLALEALEVYVASNGIEILSDGRYAPVERLRRHFRANWKIVKDRDYTAGCFLGTMSSEIADSHLTARAAFSDVFLGWSSAIVRVVREAQAQGETANTTDPKVLGRFILNAWQGALVRMKVAKSDEPFKDFNAVVFDLLLK